jgi:hypothetical protein
MEFCFVHQNPFRSLQKAEYLMKHIQFMLLIVFSEVYNFKLEAHKKLPIKFEERKNNNFNCFSKDIIETSKVSENKIEIIFGIQRKITLVNIIN